MNGIDLSDDHKSWTMSMCNEPLQNLIHFAIDIFRMYTDWALREDTKLIISEMINDHKLEIRMWRSQMDCSVMDLNGTQSVNDNVESGIWGMCSVYTGCSRRDTGTQYGEHAQ